MKPIACLTILLLAIQGLSSQSLITTTKAPNSFSITAEKPASIYVDENDDWLAVKAATLLQGDIEMVTGKKPNIVHVLTPSVRSCIIIGTTTGSSLIKKLAAAGKLDISSLEGKWEAYRIQTINNPLPELQNALVITGSDKRGAAYGVFELSRQMGVSPWYWWADVPIKKRTSISIRTGAFTFPSPSVKYRGIFINDEAPAFSGWTKEKFGGVNHLVYEKVFELLLRLKGNYLWPAMWGNAFNDDDTLNPVLADKWGIVMGTSHHEPMLRAQQEWKRYGKGDWDYTKNDTVLRKFWEKGIQNMRTHESIVTVGMRGDGDMPMTEGTAIQLLERIVKDQRAIIENVTGKPASQTPQMWALYKEVQDYYDKGMRVPDDITLLLCDDNWGNIRRLPHPGEKPRTGGYGIYYHFDYVGDPRNYKWINTNNLARVWEQMHLACEHGVDRVWIVNVGDLKPMELPISFFLDYAWNTRAWNEANIPGYYTKWANEQFGPSHAKQIGDILRKYAQYAARKKPELLDADTYNLSNYNEADRILNQWLQLKEQAEKIAAALPAGYKDAYFQLVLHPVQAFTNLHQLYYAIAKNHQYASNNDPQANQWANKAKEFYIKDSLLSLKYNKELSNGKWSHMMDQTHIGYTYWQQPPNNAMPTVTYVDTKGPTETEKKPSQTLCTSILAAHYSKAASPANIQWKKIPGIGREGDGMTYFPVTSTPAGLDAAPRLEYEFQTNDAAAVSVNAFFSPSLNFYKDQNGLQYAVSIDNERPQIVSINKDDSNKPTWEKWVADNIIIKTTTHTLLKPGKHILTYRALSPGIILQKLIIDPGGLKPSYLGPPETIK